SVLYGFDSATPDIYSGTNLGGYELQSLNISLGGYTTTLTNPGYPSGVILVGDNNSLDSYGVVFVNGGPIFSGLINGWQLQSGDFSISSGNTTAWSNDSLILSTSLLNSLPYSSLSLTFVGAPDTVRHPGQFGGQFTTTPFSITVVPEPSTFVLLGAGTLSLFAYVWRRRNLAA
ncbi:MAG: PEP-CTERM sorting domain-containing protein, partial [Thermoguttaceae bacterium]